MSTKSINPMGLLQSSFANVGRVYLPVIVLSIPSLLQVLLTSQVKPGPITLIVNLIFSLVILPWFTGAAIFYLYNQFAQTEVTLGQSLQLASTKIVQLFLGGLLLTLILIPGFIVLVIPGIYLAVRLGFTLYSITLENCSAIEGIKRSWRLVEGRWWSVFTADIFIFLVLILPIMIVSNVIGGILASGQSAVTWSAAIFGLLLNPIVHAYLILLYMRLRTNQTGLL